MNCSRSAVDLPSSSSSSDDHKPESAAGPKAADTSSSSAGAAASSSSRLKSFGAWLQQRSKSLNEVHLLKPWKKRWTSRQRSSNGDGNGCGSQQRRELPPVPPSPTREAGEGGAPNNENEEDSELVNLAIDLDELSPGTAFMPDDQFDYPEDEGGGTEGGGTSEDFSQSLERVKEVRKR